MDTKDTVKSQDLPKNLKNCFHGDNKNGGFSKHSVNKNINI